MPAIIYYLKSERMRPSPKLATGLLRQLRSTRTTFELAQEALFLSGDRTFRDIAFPECPVLPRSGRAATFEAQPR